MIVTIIMIVLTWPPLSAVSNHILCPILSLYTTGTKKLVVKIAAGRKRVEENNNDDDHNDHGEPTLSIDPSSPSNHRNNNSQKDPGRYHNIDPGPHHNRDKDGGSNGGDYNDDGSAYNRYQSRESRERDGNRNSTRNGNGHNNDNNGNNSMMIGGNGYSRGGGSMHLAPHPNRGPRGQPGAYMQFHNYPQGIPQEMGAHPGPPGPNHGQMHPSAYGSRGYVGQPHHHPSQHVFALSPHSPNHSLHPSAHPNLYAHAHPGAGHVALPSGGRRINGATDCGPYIHHGSGPGFRPNRIVGPSGANLFIYHLPKDMYEEELYVRTRVTLISSPSLPVLL